MRTRRCLDADTLRRTASWLLTSALFLVAVGAPLAQTVNQTADKPFVVEYYYKAKWGYADEFIRLFKKNHFPVLKKEKDLGRILKITASAPRYHTLKTGAGTIA